MNEHYCCDNIIPRANDGIIMCVTCGTVLCDAPKSMMQNGLLSSPQTKQKVSLRIDAIPDSPDVATTHIDENDMKLIITEFQRQKYTKERIKFCSRTMIKIMINNVGLVKKYGHLVEDIRERLVKEKW
jgi:hypothetical protein